MRVSPRSSQRLWMRLASERQALRRSLNSSRCHFCIYQSAIGEGRGREKLVLLYTEFILNKASMYTLCYVDIDGRAVSLIV